MSKILGICLTVAHLIFVCEGASATNTSVTADGRHSAATPPGQEVPPGLGGDGSSEPQRRPRIDQTCERERKAATFTLQMQRKQQIPKIGRREGGRQHLEPVRDRPSAQAEEEILFIWRRLLHILLFLAHADNFAKMDREGSSNDALASSR